MAAVAVVASYLAVGNAPCRCTGHARLQAAAVQGWVAAAMAATVMATAAAVVDQVKAAVRVRAVRVAAVALVSARHPS